MSKRKGKRNKNRNNRTRSSLKPKKTKTNFIVVSSHLRKDRLTRTNGIKIRASVNRLKLSKGLLSVELKHANEFNTAIINGVTYKGNRIEDGKLLDEILRDLTHPIYLVSTLAVVDSFLKIESRLERLDKRSKLPKPTVHVPPKVKSSELNPERHLDLTQEVYNTGYKVTSRKQRLVVNGANHKDTHIAVELDYANRKVHLYLYLKNLNVVYDFDDLREGYLTNIIKNAMVLVNDYHENKDGENVPNSLDVLATVQRYLEDPTVTKQVLLEGATFEGFEYPISNEFTLSYKSSEVTLTLNGGQFVAESTYSTSSEWKNHFSRLLQLEPVLVPQ